MTIINLNDRVAFGLTAQGRRIAMMHDQARGLPRGSTLRALKHGNHYEAPLHAVMALFGEALAFPCGEHVITQNTLELIHT